MLFASADTISPSTCPSGAISIVGLICCGAALLALAWLGLVGPPMLKGTPPAGLESAITMVIQSMDLGVIVPTSALTAYLLLKRRPWGYALSTVILLKILTMGTALISMIIVQMSAGVAVDPVVSVAFVLISLSGITLAVVTLRTIRDDRIEPVPQASPRGL